MMTEDVASSVVGTLKLLTGDKVVSYTVGSMGLRRKRFYTRR